MTGWKGRAAAAIAAAAVVTVSGTPAAAAPAVSIRLRSEAESAVGSRTAYLLRVDNAAARPVDITVSLQLPVGARSIRAGDSGWAGGNAVIWRLSVPAGTGRDLHGTAMLGPRADVTTACVTDGNSARVFDCAAVRHSAAAGDAGRSGSWRGIVPYALLTALAVALVWAARRRWRRARRARATDSRPGDSGEPDARKVALVALLALLALAVPATVAVAVLVPRLTAAADRGGGGTGAAHTGQGGWTGPHHELERGTPAGDGAVEFTVFRMDCPGAGARACRAVVALRNTSGQPQSWTAGLQRLYTGGGDWVTADPAAGAAANGGADVFLYPVKPGQRILATLVFRVPAEAQPTRLELREGVFARGVYLPLR